MVKLTFKPDINCNLKSKSSTFSEQDISPFRLLSLEEFNETTNTDVDSVLVPTKTKDIIGLENCHYVLKNWYNNYNKKGLVIIGPTGCGKSSLVGLFCKEESIKLLSIKLNDTTKSKKDILLDIRIFVEYNEIFFTNNSSKLILFDEYTNNYNDVISVIDINTIISEYTHIPVMVISSDSKGSGISELKKSNEVYYISQINKNLLFTWINQIQKHELIIMSPDCIHALLKKCKSDKRLLLNCILFLKGDNNGDIERYIESFYKDEEINIYEFVGELFDKTDIHEIFKIYETDGYILANMIHENYLDFSEDIESAVHASDSISLGDVVFSDMYDSNKIFSPDVHCFFSMCLPGYYSRSEKNKTGIRSSVINNRHNIYLNNQKIIHKLNKDRVSILSYSDIFTIKKILTPEIVKCKVLSDNKIDFLRNLIGTLDGDIDKLELIYKHFSEFNSKEQKTKIFTNKFKEKLQKIKI